MGKRATALSARESQTGIDYLAMIAAAGFESISLRDVLTGFAAVVLAVNVAGLAIDHGMIEPMDDDTNIAPMDPVLAEVGDIEIYLSEAHAVLKDAGRAPTRSAVRSVVVDDLADQAALASAAREAGLDEALELRAEMALAQREILATAFLNLSVKQAVTPEAIQAAYAAELENSRARQRVSMRRLRVATEAEATALRGRINGVSDFDRFARRRSLDVDTRDAGGDVGVIELGSLPPAVADTLAQLPLDQVSEPIKGAQGWYLVMVEARQATRMPSFDEMKPRLERRLKLQAMEATLASARAGAGYQEHPGLEDDRSIVLPSAVAIGAAW